MRTTRGDVESKARAREAPASSMDFRRPLGAIPYTAPRSTRTLEQVAELVAADPTVLDFRPLVAELRARGVPAL